MSTPSLTLNLRVTVDRRTLVWAAAYMLYHGKAHPYLMKRFFLEFLREQIALFGIHHDSLMGSDDFAEHLPTAEAWVTKHFPEVV